MQVQTNLQTNVMYLCIREIICRITKNCEAVTWTHVCVLLGQGELQSPVPAPAPAATAKGQEGVTTPDQPCRAQAQIYSAHAPGLDTKASCYLTWSFNCSVLRRGVAGNIISTCSKLVLWDPFNVHILGFGR